MNYLFKKEFMSLNKAQLARFVARIAGVKLTNNSPIKKNTPSDPTLYEIKYVDDDEIDEYKIVGSQEADPFMSKISNESPIAKAIMNKRVGDIVEVESPNGVYKIEITEIK